MNKIMLDLETFSTKSNAAIVSIGAVKFDSTNVLDEFYINVDLSSSLESGSQIDGKCIQFWMEQNDCVRNALFDKPKSLKDALVEFSVWAGDIDELWGNGADFDNVILRNSYEQLGLVVPWDYHNNCCYRTACKLMLDEEFEMYGEKHNALNDAKSQALHLMRILGIHIIS
jgi:hypothetical protein